MQQPREEPRLLGAPVLEQQHAVLDRHEPVVRPVDEQQPTARPVEQPALDEAEVALRARQQLLGVRVPVLLGERGKRRPRVLVVRRPLEPRAREEVVRAGALAHGAREPRRVRVGRAHGVVAAGREAPRDDAAHIEGALLFHPVG